MTVLKISLIFFTIKEHSGVNGNKENMFRDKEIIEVFYYNESLQ